MLLTGFVFRVLCIVQVQGADFTYHKGLYTGLVTLLSNDIRLFGYVQLLRLVVEVSHQQKDVLVKVHLFLTDSGQDHFTVALCHPYLAAALAPVKDRNLDAYLHNLIIKQVPVG